MDVQLYQVGDRVEWTSQSSGTVRTKTGEVVQVVGPGERPNGIRNPGIVREHISYVIRATTDAKANVRPRLYWPRVKNLRKVEE